MIHMTYIEEVAQMIRLACGEAGDWNSSDDYAPLWLGYAVLALSRGSDTSLEDVHDAWSAWAVIHHKGDHRSLIPFHDLSRDVQILDREYCEAILDVVDDMGLE